MVDNFIEYFEKDSAIDVFCGLDLAGKRFTELKDEVRVSPSTMLCRLDEAKELGLVTQLPAEDPQYKKQAYILTERGWQIRLLMFEEFHLPAIQTELRKIEQEFDGAVDAFREQLKDEAETIREYSTDLKTDKDSDE